MEDTSTWKCVEGCKADCCGAVPMSKSVVKKNEHLAQIQPIKVHQLSGDDVYVETEDMRCVFLNRATHKCVIYDDRPTVCREYGQIADLPCPYVALNGRPRSPAKVKRMRRWISHDTDMKMKKIEEVVRHGKAQAQI